MSELANQSRLAILAGETLKRQELKRVNRGAVSMYTMRIMFFSITAT